MAAARSSDQSCHPHLSAYGSITYQLARAIHPLAKMLCTNQLGFFGANDLPMARDFVSLFLFLRMM